MTQNPVFNTKTLKDKIFDSKQKSKEEKGNNLKELEKKLNQYNSTKLFLPIWSFEEYEKKQHTEILDDIKIEIGNVKQLSKIHRFILCFLPIKNYDVSHSLLLSICDNFFELLSLNTIPIIINEYDDDDLAEIIFRLQHPMASNLLSLNLDQISLETLGLTGDNDIFLGGPFRTIMTVTNNLTRSFPKLMKKFGIFIVENGRIECKILSNDDLILDHFGIILQDLVVKVTDPQFFVLNLKSLFIDLEFAIIQEIETEFKRNLEILKISTVKDNLEFELFLKNETKYLFFSSYILKNENEYSSLLLYEEIKRFKAILNNKRRNLSAKFILDNYFNQSTSLFPNLTKELLKKFDKRTSKETREIINEKKNNSPLNPVRRELQKKKESFLLLQKLPTVLPDIEKFEIKDLSNLFEFQNYSEKDFSTSRDLFDQVEIYLKNHYLFNIYKENFLNSLEFEVLIDFLKKEKKFVKRIDYLFNDDFLNFDDLNIINLCNKYCEIYQQEHHFFSPRLSNEKNETKTPRFEKK
eukprot:gene10357-2886_t